MRSHLFTVLYVIGVCGLVAGNIWAYRAYQEAQKIEAASPKGPPPNPYESLLETSRSGGPSLPTIPRGIGRRWVNQEISRLIEMTIERHGLTGRVEVGSAPQSGGGEENGGGTMAPGLTGEGGTTAGEAPQTEAATSASEKLGVPEFMQAYQTPCRLDLDLNVPYGSMGRFLSTLDNWPVIIRTIEIGRQGSGGMTDHSADFVLRIEMSFLYLRQMNDDDSEKSDQGDS